MRLYSEGILYILLGIVIYATTPYLLNFVQDKGKNQEKVLRTIALFFITIGILLGFIKIDRIFINLIVIIVPWIIYFKNYKNQK